MDSASNERLVRDVYAAQANGDLDTYVSHLTEDFTLHIPGRSQIAGHYVGAAEVRRHFAEIALLSGGSFQTEIHDVLASADHVVGLIEAKAQRDGGWVELPRVHLWHMRAGKLAELWLHPVDQYVFDAYWQ